MPMKKCYVGIGNNYTQNSGKFYLFDGDINDYRRWLIKECGECEEIVFTSELLVIAENNLMQMITIAKEFQKQVLLIFFLPFKFASESTLNRGKIFSHKLFLANEIDRLGFFKNTLLLEYCDRQLVKDMNDIIGESISYLGESASKRVDIVCEKKNEEVKSFLQEIHLEDLDEYWENIISEKKKGKEELKRFRMEGERLMERKICRTEIGEIVDK